MKASLNDHHEHTKMNGIESSIEKIEGENHEIEK
jgi:hypothetical protein